MAKQAFCLKKQKFTHTVYSFELDKGDSYPAFNPALPMSFIYSLYGSCCCSCCCGDGVPYGLFEPTLLWVVMRGAWIGFCMEIAKALPCGGDPTGRLICTPCPCC